MIENISLISIALSVLLLIVGIMIGYFVYHLKLSKKKDTAVQLIEGAKQKAEKINKDRLYQFKVELQKKRSIFQKELQRKEEKNSRLESQLMKKEKDLRREENQVKIKNDRLTTKEKKINELEELLYEKNKKVDTLISKQNIQLQRITNLSNEEAKAQLFKNLEKETKLESIQVMKEIRDEARENAQREAKEIIANAIENLAFEFTMEVTLSTVELPNERFKGMIIGKEGRNIRAFEEVTGVKVIVDDTPELVVLSGYDPVAREIARITMKNLIKNKNINSKNIQQMFNKATAEVQRSIRKAADSTLNELGITHVHPIMRENLGRLRYRYSYGQNMLQHAKEVSLLTGSMAAELGFNVKLARRAGLFHDIGKAISNSAEGSHVTLGVEIAEKCKEHKVVINAILAHHEEAEPISPISVLVTASDKISGSRPGARRDSLEAYTKRITNLEDIANSFDGVSKTYAISAGREIRVIVEPERISDQKAELLSTDIATKIRSSMEYPGQIKVCVIRKTVGSKFTDDFSEN
jgi:ribonuclease Y